MIFGSLFGGGNSNNNSRFRVGDKVIIKYRDSEGYVIDIQGSRILVRELNGRVDSYPEHELRKLGW